MKKIAIITIAIFILVCLCLASIPVMAKWPTKPIIITIPWSSANDASTIISNRMAPLLSKEIGVPIKVINKAGCLGILGTNFVAQSKPDGYIVALSSIGPMLTQPIIGVTPYKTDDFEPIGIVWTSSFLLAARGDAPYNNLKELAEYAKTHEVKLGHRGLGTVPTLIAMNVAYKGGFQWKETAFSELSACLLTLEDMDVITVRIKYVVDCVKKKKAKVLAIMNRVRYDVFPEVPTVSEQGFGKDYSRWFGLFMPKGTPAEIRKKFEDAWFKVMEYPEIAKLIKNTGAIPIKIRAEEAKRQIADERAHFTKVMKELNLIKEQ